MAQQKNIFGTNRRLMGHGAMNKISVILVMVVIWCVGFISSASAMQSLNDGELAGVTGQSALIMSQYIGVNELGNPNSDISFYRMILNAKLAMNMNIDHMQLGCGGFNDQSVPHACDVDINYLRLMGRRPGTNKAGSVGSKFIMVRPYLTFAIKHDGSPTKRQFVGMQLGSAISDGFMGIGEYNPNLPGCTPGTASGNGAIQCNRGINRISGYMGLHMVGKAYGCFTLNFFTGCTPPPAPGGDEIATFDAKIHTFGTRINRLHTVLTANTSGAALIAGISLSANATIMAHLRFTHSLAINPNDAAYDGDDFFMSFQREPVQWPTYGKTCNGNELCFSHEANPGWWMNVPMAELNGLKTYGIEAGLQSLAGMTMQDPDFYQRPPDNCYGALTFC